VVLKFEEFVAMKNIGNCLVPIIIIVLLTVFLRVRASKRRSILQDFATLKGY